MIYVSWEFYFFVTLLLILYYLLPLKFRWWILLIGSLGFFYWIDAEGTGVFLITILFSYLMGLLLHSLCNCTEHSSSAAKRDFKCKLCLLIAILIIIAPLLVIKNINFILREWMHKPEYDNLIVPLGISFYTLQMISYLVDIYQSKIVPQKNLLKYALFISFFPQIVQGPIPRYEQLGAQLCEGHKFDERTFTKGFQLIIWGFFLKLMIADRAAIIVNTVFDNFPVYQGFYIIVAGILYSIQLYTDFLACVVLAKGTAALFGIELAENFNRPYHSRSIKEFWRRWHISLCSWLRDYVYIPLGGSRKGKLVKYLNLMLTFSVSGLWHGTGYTYLFWGALNAVYQIAGEITAPIKNRIYNAAKISKDSFLCKALQTMGTFFWIMLAWVIFRAKNLETGITMITSVFTVYNPWILFNDSLFYLGVTWKEFILLLISIFVLCVVERKQEAICIRDWILEQHLLVRWSLYIAAICAICVFGAYGFGYEPQDFIYGEF